MIINDLRVKPSLLPHEYLAAELSVNVTDVSETVEMSSVMWFSSFHTSPGMM